MNKYLNLISFWNIQTLKNSFLVINAHAHLTPTAHLTPSPNPELFINARALIGQFTVSKISSYRHDLIQILSMKNSPS